MEIMWEEKGRINQRREKNILKADCACEEEEGGVLFYLFILMVQCSDEEPSFAWIVGCQCW